MNLHKTLLAAGLSVAAVHGAAHAERAAGIDYKVTSRPAQVRADYAAAPDADLKYLTMTAMDGFQVLGALQQPRSKPVAETTVVIDVHGSGDSYDVPPNVYLAEGLPPKGYAVLGINTRQSGDKVNTDNFMSVRRDVEAAVYTARALGYRKLVLLGHSLGNIQVQYYAANNWDSDIKGVVLLGAFGSLPWKSRHLLVQNEENWAQLEAAAAESLKQGTVDQVMPVKMGSYTGQAAALTAQHFLTYRAAASSAADGTYWIKRVPYPVLMVRDESDGVIQRFEPFMLLSAAHEPGSLVPSIQFTMLPDKNLPSLKAHYFVDNRQPMVDTVAQWLDALKP
jgi:pimeloyl-ACP methyl ester carboxylesterase